jgi:carbamoyltransferase
MSVIPSRYLSKLGLGKVPITYTPHHASHAAAGYYTSPFDNAAVVVLDAIGEFECASIWRGQGTELKKVWSASYPNSLGLFYSAFTNLIGYRPILEEHLLQQKSNNGDPKVYYQEVKGYFSDMVSLTRNLHRGVYDWPYLVQTEEDLSNIAAAVQTVFEEQVSMVMEHAQQITGSQNLVYMGGCAMNSRANRVIRNKWNDVWSLKNPGDPSSAVGAVLYHTKQRITSETQGFRV